MALCHFTACGGFDKHIFQAEILDRLISVFLDDLFKLSFRFLEALGGL
jgi:hypothetical protein